MTACVWSECTVYVYVILMKASPIFLLLAAGNLKQGKERKKDWPGLHHCVVYYCFCHAAVAVLRKLPPL